jgi:hypothetical protein
VTESIITRAMLGTVRTLTHPRHLPAPARRWTDAEWELIRRGHRSRSEQDRWNAVVEQGRLFFYRRGSGVGIYEAQFTLVRDGARVITELVMNADESVHQVDSPQLHALHLEALVDSLLLGEPDSRAIRALREAPQTPVPA